MASLCVSQDLRQGEKNGELSRQVLVMVNQREYVVERESRTFQRHPSLSLPDVVMLNDISMGESQLHREAGVRCEGTTHQEVPRLLAVEDGRGLVLGQRGKEPDSVGPDKPLPWRERGEAAAVGATIAASHDTAVAYTSLLNHVEVMVEQGRHLALPLLLLHGHHLTW